VLVRKTSNFIAVLVLTVFTLTGCMSAPAQQPKEPFSAIAKVSLEVVYQASIVAYVPTPPVSIRVPKLETIWETSTQAVGSFIPPENVIDPGENEFRPMWFDGPKYGGMPGGDDTVYVGGHTSRYGITPSNAFYDRDSQTSNIVVGDKIYLVNAAGKEFCYVVDQVLEISKRDLENDTENRFWQHEVGLLAYVLCAQDREDVPSSRALIIFAKQQPNGC
jgi:hypothetical protein